MDIQGAHIFSVGTWNKVAVDDSMLDQIVDAFNRLQQAGRVPLKFGHNEDQPITDGQPALGWVSRVWKDGGRLLADFADMPSRVYSMVQKGLYKFVSIELLKNAERNGEKYPYVLDAVALLGADPPAVGNLEDLQKLTLSRSSFKFAEALGFTRGFTNHGDTDIMDEKAMEAAIAKAMGPLQAQVTALTEAKARSDGEVAKFKADNEKLTLELAEKNKAERETRVKFARDAATEILEGAVRAKKILPAQREAFTKHFKLADDEAVLKLELRDLEGIVGITATEAKKAMESRQAFSRDPKATDGGVVEDPNLTLIEKARAYCDTHKGVDMFTATNRVLRLNPQLQASYLAHNFELPTA